MHVHVMYYSSMRTTIEIPDEMRAELLRIAAKRGEKGFSSVVQDAVAVYLDQEKERRHRLQEARRYLGSISDETAEWMLGTIREVRSRWR